MAAPSKTYLTRGIILRARPFGEKDRLLSIFAEEQGNIRAIARGARKTKSKLAAATQPFVRARFVLIKKRSLDLLTQAEIETMHRVIATDAFKSAWASYLCELCEKLPEGMPVPEIYAALDAALSQLGSNKSTFMNELVGHWFEIQYLSVQGYSPTIGHCIVCEEKIVLKPAERERPVAFSVRHGGTVCDSCAGQIQSMKIPAQALRLFHQLSRSKTPPNSSESIDLKQTEQHILKSLRELLRLNIERHLEIRTKSRTFLMQMLADADAI